ncbi:uncharacterized protein LOC107217846 [Neodiprion lecontei]|uniref:Uncharacterized protein LOC107217846 n=1 Tax=Neodiprion lecontei TaxID=441921 RepID=A0A6J0B9W8_NEOLC|nr:uncharacterized protein LOC107217846 [Neodiprion lecontei]
MALKLGNCAKGGYLNILQTALSRHKHTAVLSGDLRNSNENNQKKSLHASAVKSYPSAPTIPLPQNMTQIFGNETGRFTPERARDITGPILFCQANGPATCSNTRSEGLSLGDCTTQDNPEHSYTDSYDCTGAVSLNGSMQSNVPQPFSSEGKSMHLNMPGGIWSRDDKYIAYDMQNSHYSKSKLCLQNRSSTTKGADINIIARSLLSKNLYCTKPAHVMSYSTGAGTTQNESEKSSNELPKPDEESRAAKLKRAVKDYGSTVIVFHVGISLASLGICYVVIYSGVDVPSLISSLGFVDNERIQNIVSNSSTFVIAYAIHKLFAPARISITLATTPFLVKYLRKIGVLKNK